jgi:Cysteine rich repeat
MTRVAKMRFCRLGSQVRLSIVLSLTLLGQATAQTQLTPATRNEIRALAATCKPDIDQFCSNVQPGGGRILACLQHHQPDVSIPCQQAMVKGEALKAQLVKGG